MKRKDIKTLSTKPKMKTWGVDYRYQGKELLLEITAPDYDEALRHLQAIKHTATIFGEVVATIPVTLPGPVGWWVPWVIALRNFLFAKAEKS